MLHASKLVDALQRTVDLTCSDCQQDLVHYVLSSIDLRLATSPRSWRLVRAFVEFLAQPVLFTKIISIKVEEWAELRHHPRHGDVGEFHVAHATTNVSMSAGKPDLLQILRARSLFSQAVGGSGIFLTVREP